MRAVALAIDLFRGRAEVLQDGFGKRERHLTFAREDRTRASLLERRRISEIRAPGYRHTQRRT